MERTPAWSPDGKTLAYFSDESGEYALHLKPQNGGGETKKIALAGKSAFYFDPKWSPDSKAIAFSDNMDNLWMVEIASGKATKVDTNHLYDLERGFNWSGGFEVDCVREISAESPAGDLDLFGGERQERADYRWHERRAAPRVRPRWAVSVFRCEHQLRAHHQRAGHEQRRTRRHQQHIPGGAAQQYRVAPGSGER